MLLLKFLSHTGRGRQRQCILTASDSKSGSITTFYLQSHVQCSVRLAFAPGIPLRPIIGRRGGRLLRVHIHSVSVTFARRIAFSPKVHEALSLIGGTAPSELDAFRAGTLVWRWPHAPNERLIQHLPLELALPEG